MNEWKPPGGGAPLQLNLHNHCLLCLQHVDPFVLQAIATQNPKGLTDFHPVLQYLTGTLTSGENKASTKWYPVTGQMPPLCTICYDICAELHTFHGELVQLQRKIQNQTETARRIASATTLRKNGGTKDEFFNRLRNGGIPWREVKGLQGFLDNFHGLISDAERKPVFPEMMTLEQLTTTCDPFSGTVAYSVMFEKPQVRVGETEVLEVEETFLENEEESAMQFVYEGDEEEDNDWMKGLSSDLIIEDVEEEEEGEGETTELTTEISPRGEEDNIEVIDLDDEEDHEETKEQTFYQPVILSVSGGVQYVGVPAVIQQQLNRNQSNVVSSSRNGRKGEVTGFQCRICNKIYRSNQRLRFHQQDHMPGGRPKPFACEYCGNRFSSRKLMEQHARIHTGERPFECNICGDRFRQESTLYRHKIAHDRQQKGLTRKSRLGQTTFASSASQC